jgi:Ca-activated chloride channel family protein
MQKLLSILHQIDKDKVNLSQNLRSNYLDYGYYLVFISLLCMLPFFRRGLLILLLCCCFVHPANASFLLNDNQEGFLLFKGEQYEMALNKFKDSIWRGVTLYKLDKQEDALKEFSKEKNNEIAIYNTGVILTKLCKYTEALSAFNEVLRKNPNNEDAFYNKQVLDDLFVKAKDNPSILNCQNNQQQNNYPLSPVCSFHPCHI